MCKTLSLLCLVFMLVLTVPAQAQLREAAQNPHAPVKLYDQGESGFSLNRFFSPAHFRMSHSVEFSTGSFGGVSSSLGMYTNTMMFQFNQKLAARVDMAVAYSPGGAGDQLLNLNGNNSPRVFLRNAEVAYRPNEKMQIHLQVRQSPYGYYGAPFGSYGYGYGGYGRYGYGYGGGFGGFNASFNTGSGDLFWNDNLK